MNRFAALIDRLAYEPRRNAKLRLMTDYFRDTPDPERGWALAALTGALSFRHAKPGLIRGLIQERADPVLEDRLRAEPVAAVHQRDVGGDVRQVDRLLDRGVAAADHGDLVIAVEEAVAGCAG